MNEYQMISMNKKLNGIIDEIDQLKNGFSTFNNEFQALKKNVELIQYVCMGLAFGHYEVEDAVALMIQYPKLVKKYKKRLKDQFVPLQQLHSNLYVANRRSCKSVIDELDSSARNQQYTINQLVENGFETRAGQIFRQYSEQRKNSLFHRHKQRIFQVLLGFFGVIVTSIHMIVSFFKMPEVLPKLLFGRYKRYEIALYFKRQYSMFFSEEKVTDKQQNVRDVMSHLTKLMQDVQVEDDQNKSENIQIEQQTQPIKLKISLVDKIYRFIAIFCINFFMFSLIL